MTNISESAPTKACRTCLAKICSNGNPLYSDTTESTCLRKRLEALLPEILTLQISKHHCSLSQEIPMLTLCDTCKLFLSTNSKNPLNPASIPSSNVNFNSNRLLNLRSIPDSAVCSDCCTAINSFYQFKQRCLEIENNIQDLLPSLTGDGETESNHRPSESDSPHQTNTCVKLECETDVNSGSLGHLCGGIRNECPDPEEASPVLPNAGEESEPQNDSQSSSKEQEETLQQLSQLELVDIFSVEFNTDAMEICDGAGAEDCVQMNNEKSQVKKKGANRRGGKRVKQTYICHDCGYSAAYKSKLVKHMSKHRSQQGKSNTPTRTSFKKLVSQLKDDTTCSLYKCDQCHYRFKSKATLKSHMINHNKKKSYKCDKCDFRTAYSNYIGIHKQLHSEERPLKCPKCDYRCVQTQNLKLHLANHTGEKKYKCDKCDYQTQYYRAFDIHMRMHSGVKSFNCKICDYSCITKRMLDTHLKIHTGDKPYKCKFCEHRTTQLSHLKIHLRTHTGEKPYKCNVCDYCTVSKTALRQHSNIHLEDKPFKCSKCDYRTTQLTHLKIHLRQHTGEKPFHCGTCPYKASSGSMLRIHMRTHTGEKPYKCSECDYASTQLSPLKVHMKRHSKLKNPSFKCDSCDFATVHKNVLKRHMKTH